MTETYHEDEDIELGIHGARSEMGSLEIKMLGTEEIEKRIEDVKIELAELEKEIRERRAALGNNDEEEGFAGHA